MDFAIVTIRVPAFSWQTDMELPVKMRLEDLVQKILDALKEYDGEMFGSVSHAELQWKGKLLNRDMTLADYQVWDGSVLEIILK